MFSGRSRRKGKYRGAVILEVLQNGLHMFPNAKPKISPEGLPQRRSVGLHPRVAEWLELRWRPKRHCKLVIKDRKHSDDLGRYIAATIKHEPHHQAISSFDRDSGHESLLVASVPIRSCHWPFRKPVVMCLRLIEAGVGERFCRAAADSQVLYLRVFSLAANVSPAAIALSGWAM